MNTKRITDIIHEYKRSPANTEFELRFGKISWEVFKSLITNIRTNDKFKNPKVEHTINTISKNVHADNSSDTYIRRQEFVDGVKTSDSLIIKNKIYRPIKINDYIDYTINLSTETPSEKKFNTNSDALVRFKNRISYDLGKWRVDLTAVKQGLLKDLAPVLVTLKNKIFGNKVTPSNYLERIDTAIIDWYEMEIEYISDKNLLLPDDINVVQVIFEIMNKKYLTDMAYQDEIYNVATYIANPQLLHLFKHKFGLKKLAKQVIGINKKIYSNIYPPIGYYLTDKADGFRCIIIVNGNRCRIISDKLYEQLSGDTFVAGKVTIADAEMVVRSDTIHLYLFDVMMLSDVNIAEKPLRERVDKLNDAVAIISEFYPNTKSKRYVIASEANLENNFRAIWEAPHEYEVDGIIMSTPDKSYNETKHYKWKPAETNTIDFLAKLVPKNKLGIEPLMPRVGHDLYILFVGINDELRRKLGIKFLPGYQTMFPHSESFRDYYPIQFSSTSNPNSYLYYSPTNENLDSKVVEMRLDGDEWKLLRVRVDRGLEKNDFGNDYKVAEDTYQNYIYPIHFEDLWNLKSGYFATVATDIYNATNRYKRYIISQVLNEYLAGADTIIDLASGRGADLHRYQYIGVKNALFIDIDADAIAELIQRKFDIINVKKTQTTSRVQTFMKIHTAVFDLKEPYEKLIQLAHGFAFDEGNIDGMVCNFAFHYFCDTSENLRNMVIGISKMIKKNGIFIFTTMSGELVFNLLKKTGTNNEWSCYEDTVKKYSIKKHYTGKTLANVGQKISVKLPFSGDEYYEEPLCNLKHVIGVFEKCGFKLEANTNFDCCFNDFAKKFKMHLSADDKKYISLHHFVVLRKTKEMK